MKDIQEVLRRKRAQIVALKRQIDALEAASHALRAVDYLLTEEESNRAEEAVKAALAVSVDENQPSPGEPAAPAPQPPQPERLDIEEYPQQKAS
jgi:hypothetical protein